MQGHGRLSSAQPSVCGLTYSSPCNSAQKLLLERQFFPDSNNQAGTNELYK